MHSGDGCDLVKFVNLCKYDLRKGDLFVLRWAKGATSEPGTYFFKAANGWWRCAQYVGSLLCSDRC